MRDDYGLPIAKADRAAVAALAMIDANPQSRGALRAYVVASSIAEELELKRAKLERLLK